MEENLTMKTEFKSDMNVDAGEVLEFAAELGHLMLENGAEIFRVEETMERISTYYGVEKKDFFVLSNGIFATGRSFAKVMFIPFKGTQLRRVVEASQLSRDIESGKYSLEQAKSKLAEIRNMKLEPAWIQVLASCIGSGCFGAIFGGSRMDCVAAAVVGLLLWIFVIAVGKANFSKIFTNACGGAFATLLCIIFHRIGFGDSLGHIMVGALIPLVPGVPFTNGIKDIANEDYLAGATRLLDALMVFFYIAMGVSITLLGYSHIYSGIGDVWKDYLVVDFDVLTQSFVAQFIMAFFGTAAFAILFGVQRNALLQCGICGMAGWIVYLALARYASFSPAEATIFGTILVAVISRFMAVLYKCPTTVFLITGIFPMVPGGGIYWTIYNVVSSHFRDALSSGATAIMVTVAIVFGIVLVNEIPQRFFKINRRALSSQQ